MISSTTRYADTSLLKLSEVLVHMVRAWSDSKTVAVNMDTLLAKARDEVKKDMTNTIKGLEKDVRKLTLKGETAKTKITGLETKNKELSKELIKLQPMPELLEK
jgi:seryl-tRNA synthetase